MTSPPYSAMHGRTLPLRSATLVLGLVACLAARPVAAQSLRGSRASMDRQNRMARLHDFTFLRTGRRVRYFASKGWLVRVRGSRDVELHGVSYPYARPEVALFLRRLGAQYRAACGEKLIVTSLTRPTTHQPRNASDRSVHPTGMAADLRYSRSRTCRRWLERVLLGLEGAGVLEATRERHPAHYHVAVFPRPYASYVRQLRSRAASRATEASSAVASSSGVTSSAVAYRVRPGDSLWTIARRHGTTVARLKRLNGLRGSRIYRGQLLEVPAAR